MDSEENATSCPVCLKIYRDPRSLACGHSFCLKCLKEVAGNNQTFPCPICRRDVDLRYTNVDHLPKNFVLCTVIEARETSQNSMCLDHNKSLDLFCQRCNVVICSKCLSMQHKGHAIDDIEILCIERNKKYGAFLESKKHLASMIEEKRDAVKQSQLLMEKNIESISQAVDNTFKKWNDALQKQHDAMFSYLDQERDQKRQECFEAERILAGSMTTLTELDTEISKLRSRDTAFVVQQYGSIKARQEDTERRIQQDIETCFTLPDHFGIEVYAPGIEEAISNIKLVDMKQAQSRPGLQNIAEIQDENVILGRKTKIENPEYLNQYLDTLVQYVHDHVVSGAESSPKTIARLAEIKPESLIAKRYQHAKEICVRYTKIEDDINELQEKNLALEILLASLDEYVTSKKQNINLDIPSAVHSDPMFLLELGQVKRIAEEFEEKKRQLSASTKEMQEMENKIKEYEQNFSYEQLRTEHQNLKTSYSTLYERYNVANAEMKQLQSMIKNLKKEKTDMYLQYKMKTETQKQETATLKPEMETLLTGLSTITGDRQTHDKVNIADLSIADKPTKLSEMYSELYDNEWTDAFEELIEKTSLSDQAAVRCLLEILMNAFHRCKEITWDRYESLKLIACTLHFKQEYVPSEINKDSQMNVQTKTTSLSLTLSLDQEQTLKNIWRATTCSLKHQSLKLMYAELSTSLCKYETELPKTYKYLTVCTDLCWKMGVQEKPMHLDLSAEKQVGQEKQFDTDKFRAYIKTGKSVAYVVWPALFIHEGGAMLAKGIAQGCQKVLNV